MLTRRRLLECGVAAAASTVVRVPASSAQSACAAPPRFPDGIELYQAGFENWSRELVLEDLWTCAPRDARDVVRLTNWALAMGWKLRARGMRHNWSPLGPAAGTSCASRVVLVDTTRHLVGSTLLADGIVRVGAGETVDRLVLELEAARHGFVATTAPGDLTLGGVIAINGHGASVRALGEERRHGTTYGSFSNLVTALEVVVWAQRKQRYVLRRVERDDPDARPLLTSLGRAFVTAMELRTGEDTDLRCQSFTDIGWTELAGTSGRTFTSFLDSAGRAEIIWFPFTEKPWLKVWSVASSQPAGSRLTKQPYNYPFSDNVPVEVTTLAQQLVEGNPAVAPLMGRTMYEVAHAGLDATRSRDLWGRSKNTMLYIKPTTLRYGAGSWAVHCARRDVQRIVGDLMREHATRVADHRARGEYPINGPLEIRVTGLDRAADAGIEGAVAPYFSGLRRRRPEWDTVVWPSVLSFAGTPGRAAFLRETERRLYATYPGAVVPEWSKGWAFSDTASWDDPTRFPRLNATGRKTMRRLDPGRVFTSPFLDRLFR